MIVERFFRYLFLLTIILAALCVATIPLIPFVSPETTTRISTVLRAVIKPVFLLALTGVLWFGLVPTIRESVERKHSRRLCEIAYTTLYRAMAENPIEMSKTKRGADLQENLKRELSLHCFRYPKEQDRVDIQGYQRYRRELLEMSRAHNG